MRQNQIRMNTMHLKNNCTENTEQGTEFTEEKNNQAKSNEIKKKIDNCIEYIFR